MTREYVNGMPQNLKSLKQILKLAFARLELENLDNVCLVIGNTGCGKSTLLSALIHGSGALGLRYEDKVVRVDRKNTKVVRKLVGIDYTEEFLKENDNKGAFKIGHSAAKSETFLPSFYKVEMPNKESMIYIDIAGLQDTGTAMVEFVNQFINKKLFSIVKNLKIIIPIMHGIEKISRGGPLWEQLEILMNIFKKQMPLMSKSIIPVLTRLVVQDENFYLSEYKEELQSVFDERLQTYRDTITQNAKNCQDL